MCINIGQNAVCLIKALNGLLFKTTSMPRHKRTVCSTELFLSAAEEEILIMDGLKSGEFHALF